MQPVANHLSRRQFFGQCSVSLGSIALLALEQPGRAAGRGVANVLAPRPPHHAPRAKNVIFIYMGGGPSQLDLFDYKPKLEELDGQTAPPSLVAGKRFAFVTEESKLMRPLWQFARHGQCGAEVSELLPHLTEVVDDIAIVKSMVTDEFNHGPAGLTFTTGLAQIGRPSIGAWVAYGLGSECQNLPAFVVLQSSGQAPSTGSSLWGSGFLPNVYAGVPFRSAGDPVLYLSSPKGASRATEHGVVRTINQLNVGHWDRTGDASIGNRVSAYELMLRMQLSCPDLIDLRDESRATLGLYGADRDQPSFARNCILARRLVERGVRFVQLLHDGWDHHANIKQQLPELCQITDQASAALIQDLKQRGLLDETLIVWSGEFGRTPMRDRTVANAGRDHHIDAFSLWLAGGGIRPGITVGQTDEIGFGVVEDPVHVNDLQATILHLLGLDHLQLTYRYQGRDFRLTNVDGHVVEKLLA